MAIFNSYVSHYQRVYGATYGNCPMKWFDGSWGNGVITSQEKVRPNGSNGVFGEARCLLKRGIPKMVILIGKPWLTRCYPPLKSAQSFGRIYLVYISPLVLNFMRSWDLWFFEDVLGTKVKCIISCNLRAEGSWAKVLNVVIFVESVVL